MSFFDFYNIPVSFRVDEPALRRVFYQNSKKYHPDFHTLSDAEQQADMLEMATMNNEAYQTLSDPDKRMRYVLEIKGLLEDEAKQHVPQDFLMDMMDINEALMELEMDLDPERLAAARQAADALEKDLDASIQPVLENYTEASGTERDLEAVLQFFLKKRYLLRIQEKLSMFAPR
jgi:molecular chaperone HscB